MDSFQMFSREEIRIGVDDIFPEEETEKEYLAAELPQLDFLPQSYVFRCGIRAIIRNMRKEEDVILYGMLKKAMELGEGYAINEYPTLAAFRGALILHSTCCVYEEEDSGKIIAFSVVCDSWFVRSRASRTAENDLFVSKEFRSKGVGKEITFLDMGISKDRGYQRAVNDMAIGNDTMINANRSHVATYIVGTIHKGAYFEGQGWVDILVTACDIDQSVRSFKELIDENKSRTQNVAIVSKI